MITTYEKDGRTVFDVADEKGDAKKVAEKKKEPEPIEATEHFSGLVYKFDREEQGTKKVHGKFDFNVFAGMAEDIKKEQNQVLSELQKPWNDEFKAGLIATYKDKVKEIKGGYKIKALFQLKKLREGKEQRRTYTNTNEELKNVMVRLLNVEMSKELIRYSNIDELAALWEENKGIDTVRFLIKGKAKELARAKGGNAKADLLLNKIRQLEHEIAEPDKVNELTRIENSIRMLFNFQNKYPVGLEKGFNSYKSEPIVTKEMQQYIK